MKSFIIFGIEFISEHFKSGSLIIILCKFDYIMILIFAYISFSNDNNTF